MQVNLNRQIEYKFAETIKQLVDEQNCSINYEENIEKIKILIRETYAISEERRLRRV